MRHRLGGVVLAGVLLAGGVACSDDELARDDTGSIVEEGTLGVMNLQVGDCFDDPSQTEEVASLDGVPCDQPHDNEIYALFDLGHDEFPGQDVMEQEASEGCLARFEDYVGVDYEASSLMLSALWPTESSWELQDDREIVCYVYDMELEPLVGSVRGTGT